ncbi:MAG: orotidine-5'-phosphate decarboxylase [Deltaproteobacteria bacterium]|nr:orotidine-5'-phosphate decarboxylase [Deltaproteobacteria bacterium]
MTFPTCLERLKQLAEARSSLLCVGLDPNPERLPESVPKSVAGIGDFLREIVEATREYAIAFKPNFAFFEALGPEGMSLLQALIKEIRAHTPVIGDAKRGDVGHTAERYAHALFEIYGCDAVTVTPYQGEDAVRPFLAHRDRLVFVLGLTSNPGASDFQLPNLFQDVVRKVRQWNDHGNAGLVVGATRSEQVREIRELSGPMPFLVPGVGAQGGSLEATLRDAEDGSGLPCLINASRSILYASSGTHYAAAAAHAAQGLQEQVSRARNRGSVSV